MEGRLVSDTATDAPAAAPNSHDRLYELLSRIIEEPERRGEISDQIEREFTQRRAVLVLDMSGFSRTTQVHGVVSLLVMIHQMRLIALDPHTVQALGARNVVHAVVLSEALFVT